ncbi:hypothetical protein PPERSA_06178 [Pseudocohnilembus persalinus]|uniref:Leucine-rich repeat n=1 Tax=Pseudocohnilembus persalinus TaxID=266149 RepID=A0A0V0R160_PSEPJ|nr:hypothetical protein PPERSA_06178 [Pseudocohnilembus persalinus]|eukprot:KRX08000.1 hypothetical protein PPERSA_06178 [Pseudocohnilembus persalinus]
MSKVYKSITEIPNYQTVKKIEAANNKIQSLESLNGVEKLKELKELKANDNQISSIPEKIQALSKLSILDLGRNHFKDIKKIKPLNSLKKLVNLNFSGNQLELTQEMLESDFSNLKLKLLNNKKLDDGKLHGDVYKEKVKLNKQAYRGIITKEQAEQEFQKLQKEKEKQRKEKNKKRKEKLLQKQNIVQKQHLLNPEESIQLKSYENETQLEKLNEISFNNKQQNKNQKQDKDVIKTNVGITRVEHNKKQTKANQKQEKKLKIVKADIFSEKKEDNVAGWDD